MSIKNYAQDYFNLNKSCLEDSYFDSNNSEKEVLDKK